MDDDEAKCQYETLNARLLRREALRRAASELATTTPMGLETALARISAEVTAEAAETKAVLNGMVKPARHQAARVKES